MGGASMAFDPLMDMGVCERMIILILCTIQLENFRLFENFYPAIF